jgi:AcrR family transcriptional regulator
MAMRHKDELKQDALFRATVKIVNEIGFAASSVAKIAKEAGVSPATIYIYYENKEDLLVSTFMAIKKRIGDVMVKGLDESKPVRDNYRTIWINLFEYAVKHGDEILYKVQFENSPYASLPDMDEILKSFEPVYQFIQKSIEQKIIKNADPAVLNAFFYAPIVTLTTSRLLGEFKPTPENIDAAFNLAWDAIKL